MNRDQLIRKLRKLARNQNKNFTVETAKGKGSHYMVTFENATSALQHELTPGRIERFLKQLGLKPSDL